MRASRRLDAALIDIDLELTAGDRLLLLGPNGAGKSTFIRVFAGLMRATSGKALIAGQPARSARGLVGVVSHATYLYEELTATENLELYARLYGVPDPRSASSRYSGAWACRTWPTCSSDACRAASNSA